MPIEQLANLVADPHRTLLGRFAAPHQLAQLDGALIRHPDRGSRECPFGQQPRQPRGIEGVGLALAEGLQQALGLERVDHNRVELQGPQQAGDEVAGGGGLQSDLQLLGRSHLAQMGTELARRHIVRLGRFAGVGIEPGNFGILQVHVATYVTHFRSAPLEMAPGLGAQPYLSP